MELFRLSLLSHESQGLARRISGSLPDTVAHEPRPIIFTRSHRRDTPELNLLTQLVEGRFVSVCDLVTTSEPGKLLRWQLQVCKFQASVSRRREPTFLLAALERGWVRV